MGNGEKINFCILFITQEDPFYVKFLFDEFLRTYKHLAEIKGVVITPAMGNKSLFKFARQMYDFYGPIDFLKMALRYAGYKIIAIAPSFLRSNNPYSLAQLCKYYGIRVIHENNLNSMHFLHKLKGMSLDLIISVAAPVIFKQDLIQLPSWGCINIHNAKLPKYRGMMPNFWQMYHNEKSVGITIHEINPIIDDGRIILQKEVDINPNETLDSLLKRTKRMGAHYMIEAINMIKSGNIKYMENDAMQASYFSFPTREDVKEFKRREKKII
ncbi:MAG: methionyl-tRNA formyltransferase [Candidatus Hodarchaeota archaeon]